MTIEELKKKVAEQVEVALMDEDNGSSDRGHFNSGRLHAYEFVLRTLGAGDKDIEGVFGYVPESVYDCETETWGKMKTPPG